MVNLSLLERDTYLGAGLGRYQECEQSKNKQSENYENLCGGFFKIKATCYSS